MSFARHSFTRLEILAPDPQSNAHSEDDYEISSICFSRSSSESSSPAEITVQDTLLNTVRGNLFENSDPWNAVKGRLDLLPPNLNYDNVESGDLFRDLVLNRDRSGVGYVPDTEDSQHCGDLTELTSPFVIPATERSVVTQREESRSSTADALSLVVSSGTGNMEAQDEISPLPVHCVTDNVDRLVKKSESDTLSVVSDSVMVEICAHLDEEGATPEFSAPGDIPPEDESLDKASVVYAHDRPRNMLKAGPNIWIAGPTLFFGDVETDEEE